MGTRKLAPTVGPAPLHTMEAWHRGPYGFGAAVYVFGEINGCCKIGVSNSPYKRLTDFRSLPVELEMKAYIVSLKAEWLERYLHTAFHDVHAKREWFRLSADDIATLAALKDISREEQIPDAIRSRHDRNLRSCRHNEIICRVRRRELAKAARGAVGKRNKCNGVNGI